MLRSALVFAVAMVLAAQSATAADYKCAKKETNVALNDHDIAVAEREASIKEMKAEITDSGGSTDDQTKVLKSFEDKLAKMKGAHEILVKECSTAAAPGDRLVGRTKRRVRIPNRLRVLNFADLSPTASDALLSPAWCKVERIRHKT